MQHIYTGNGSPSITPNGVGHHYIDLLNKQSYISVGKDNASDWRLTTSTSGASFTHCVETFSLSSNDILNQYVDLTYTPIQNSIQASVNRLSLWEGEDFILTQINGVTRLSWVNSMSSSGDEALEAGDSLKIRYIRT
jgi:hypothetical protein